MSERLWAIVLAGGDGTRLAETTRRVYGSSLPKQFQSFGRARTFLQSTLDRMQGLIPPQRTVVVVSASHETVAREQLAAFEGIEIVAQPRNQGTLPGVLLPLVHVLRRDPGADVALVPSDHDFTHPGIMLDALARARAAARAPRAAMVLLGACAEGPAIDLGWMLTKTAAVSRGAVPIREFVEKPGQALAEQLFRAGALWNTMLSVTRGEALWGLARRHAPGHAAWFEGYAASVGQPNAGVRLRELYEHLRPADFSRDLVAVARGSYAVSMEGAGWSDCGTPERLEAALGGPSSGVVATRPLPSAMTA